MPLTKQEQIFCKVNKIEIRKINTRRYYATIDLYQDDRGIQCAEATSTGEKEVLQKICDENNLFSPQEIKRLKLAIKKK